MSKFIIQVKRTLHDVDRARLEEEIKKSLAIDGFILLDKNFEIYEITEKEEK